MTIAGQQRNESTATTGSADAIAEPMQASLLEEFRDEASALPHAAQLQKGFRWLHFMPQLEQEFYEYYWRRYLRRSRRALIVAALICLPFALRDFFSLSSELSRLTISLRLLGIMPLLLIAVGLMQLPRLRKYLEMMIASGVVVVLSVLGIIVALAAQAGTPLPYEGLMLVIVFVFFVSGLRTFKAGVSTFLASVIFAGACEWVGLPHEQVLERMSFLLSLILICGVGSYLLESAVRRNFLTEKLAEFRASRDSLTLLHNRRAALQHLAQVWRVCSRERVPVSVLLIDVDHFKRYNDSHGHLAGDGCLSEVAFTLGTCLQRPMDMVARYGGEEFIGIAYGAGEEGIAKICERMRQAVHDLAITHESSPAGGLLTVSIGAACTVPAVDDSTPSSVIDEADRALYRAKELGRNRWEINRRQSVLAAAAA